MKDLKDETSLSRRLRSSPPSRGHDFINPGLPEALRAEKPEVPSTGTEARAPRKCGAACGTYAVLSGFVKVKGCVGIRAQEELADCKHRSRVDRLVYYILCFMFHA